MEDSRERLEEGPPDHETESRVPEAMEQCQKEPIGSSPGKQDFGPVVLLGREALTAHFSADQEAGSPATVRALGWSRMGLGPPIPLISTPDVGLTVC